MKENKIMHSKQDGVWTMVVSSKKMARYCRRKSGMITATTDMGIILSASQLITMDVTIVLVQRMGSTASMEV